MTTSACARTEVVSEDGGVEVTPTREQYAYTFGGVAPADAGPPGTALRLWSDDAFGGALRSVEDLSSEKVDLRFVNPQTGPFYVEGAEPGDTLALHLVALEPARDWAASAAIPFFGGMTGTDRTVEPPDRAAGHHLDLRARPRPQHRRLRRPAQRPPRRAAGGTDAGHRRRRAGRRRGALVAGPRPVRRQHGHPEMRAGATATSGSTSRGRCSRSATGTTARVRARPAAPRSRGR